MSASKNLEAAAEDIASDVRGVLASKDLDSVPHIKAVSYTHLTLPTKA